MQLPANTAGLRHRLGGYREYLPAGPLAWGAEAVWTHRAVWAQPAGMHRVLPDPSLNLAIRCRRDGGGRALDVRLVVIGPKRVPFLFRFDPGDEIAAVKVKLEWARALLGLDPRDHLDREDDLADASPRLARTLAPLAEVAAMSRSLAEVAGLLAGALVHHVCPRDAEPPAATAYALDAVRACAGRVRVEAIARQAGLSARQLHRGVRRDALYSLKGYARIARLNHAMMCADRSSRPSWARIAADAGFCDQSHLVRECRALTGLTPEPVERERRAQAEISNPY